MSDKLREAFERDLPAWWSKRLDDGSYSDPFRQKQWEGFQAGHAHAMRESADIAADGEPVAYVQNNDLRQARDYFKRYMSGDQTVDTGNLLWALQAALAHIDKAQAEPVAILHRHPGKCLLKVEYTDEVTELDDGVYPLYTSPPKSEPMTDDEMIRRGWRRCAVGQRTTQYCGQLEAAVAAEREACAKVCEEQWGASDLFYARAIRARGEK